CANSGIAAAGIDYW
nr:immunoglobulin heavy chain junction region [Macaca mulatta]MOV47451.1 immunoglobulin heavy chain junction region [Macaca mulatta]MOV47458.1 immunoglobulin heavy chain junction region [Macaca mulatta]MOV47620.1 immunoglobulin heavy chain junction region [Macaca mulatta]MOV47704.1 immunoglobulin heavy chain junction region [Macaca mulatta]